MKRLLASIALAVSLLASPVLGAPKCVMPDQFVELAQKKAPDTRRYGIIEGDALQRLLTVTVQRGLFHVTTPLQHPVSDYTEGWVIGSEARNYVSFMLITKQSAPKTCEGISLPMTEKAMLYYYSR